MNVTINDTLLFAKHEKDKTEKNLRNAMMKNAPYREVDNLRQKLGYWEMIIVALSHKRIGG